MCPRERVYIITRSVRMYLNVLSFNLKLERVPVIHKIKEGINEGMNEKINEGMM